MKQDKMFKILEKERLTLRQYYRLYIGKEDEELIRRSLKRDEGHGKEIIQSIENLFKAQEIKPEELLGENYEYTICRWRELFPKGNLPSGKPARCSEANLLKAFTWFFKTYKYDWPTIFKATKLYLSENEGSKYMKTSQYFIRKDDTSTLADCCDAVLNGTEEVQIIKEKVV